MPEVIDRYKRPDPLYEDDTETTRSCLKCQQPFQSRMGARICEPCNVLNGRAGKNHAKEVNGVAAIRRGRDPR